MLRAANDKATLFGEVGLAAVAARGRVDPVRVRYRSLWPFPNDSPGLLAADEDGLRVALALDDGVVVFARETDAYTRMNTDEYASCAVRDGVLTAEHSGNGPTLMFRPFRPDGRRFSIAPQWVAAPGVGHSAATATAPPERCWLAWGMHVTPDARRAALLAQESDGGNTVSNRYFAKRVLVYGPGGDLSAADGWRVVAQVELPELAGVHGFDNRLIRLTPDGRVLVVGTTKGRVLRYDAATGRRLSDWSLGREYEVSADGALVVGVPGGGTDLVVYRAADGHDMVRVPGFAPPAGLAGGCFTADGRTLVVSRGRGELAAYELPSGRSLWQRPSPLVPRAWPRAGTGERFVGRAADAAGLGGQLMLGDVATGRAVALLSRTGELRMAAGFAADTAAADGAAPRTGDDGTLYFQSSRWYVEIVRPFDPPALVAALGGPAPALTTVAPRPLPVASPSDPGPPGTLDASNLDALRAAISASAERDVVVEGVVGKLSLTRAGNAINVEFVGPKGQALLLWVAPPVLAMFKGQPNDPSRVSLESRRIRVRGKLSAYGGRAEALRDRLQITIDGPDDLELLD